MIYSKIIGTGKYVPQKNISNDDLSQFLETSDEWIKSRTGIENRKIAVNESLAYMGVQASINALDRANVKGEAIDLIIGATMSPDYVTPSLACLIQKEIGARKAMAFDINGACSGFLFALHTANEFIQNNTFKNILIVGAEKMSQVVNWEDRNTAVLFGDGAGAAVVKASEESGLLGFDSHSIGEDYDCLVCESTQKRSLFKEINRAENKDYIVMDGRRVFEFACKTVPKSIKNVLITAQIQPDDVDYYVLHQANIRIIEYIAKKLKQPMTKFITNMNAYGNTSAASVPIALDELARRVELKGKTVVLAGFGGGLTYGSAVLKM